MRRLNADKIKNQLLDVEINTHKYGAQTFKY